MKEFFLIYTRLLKNIILTFYADDRGIFTILTGFAAVPLLILTMGTIDLSQMAAFENQILNSAVIGIRAGRQGYGDSQTDIVKNVIIKNMGAYQYSQTPLSDKSNYNVAVNNDIQRVNDATVPDGTSYGCQQTLTIAINGTFIRTQNFSNIFSMGGMDNSSVNVPITRILTGRKYLPPIEIALVIDVTNFNPMGAGYTTQAGTYVAQALQKPELSQFIDDSKKGRSIRIMMVPYSSTVQVSYSMLNSSAHILYLDRNQNRVSGQSATGQCLTEKWNIGDNINTLPAGISTYQNYYRSGCSSAWVGTCSPADLTYQLSYTAYKKNTWHNPTKVDSQWLNFNCPSMTLIPLMDLKNWKDTNMLAFLPMLLTIPTIENRSSNTKPLPHVGLLWAVRYLNNPALWSTSRSSQDSRTKKLLFLVSGEAPLRPVPIQRFWNTKENMHLKNPPYYITNTDDVIGPGSLIIPANTPTNIDYFSALGYTQEIDRYFFLHISNTLNTNKDPKTSEHVKTTVQQKAYLTTQAIDMVKNVRDQIKQIPNIHLYSVHYAIDPNANGELISDPASFRNTYQNVLKNSCNASSQWTQEYSLLNGDYANQIFNALKSALTDSKVISDFSNYQIELQ